MSGRFDYESEDNPHRVQKIVLILWKDAYNDYDMLTLNTAKLQLNKGMPLFTSGVLVDDTEDTVTVAQDLVTTYPMVRNMRKIPKENIISMFVADVDWNEHIVRDGDLLKDANPTVLRAGKLKRYSGWRDN